MTDRGRGAGGCGTRGDAGRGGDRGAGGGSSGAGRSGGARGTGNSHGSSDHTGGHGSQVVLAVVQLGAQPFCLLLGHIRYGDGLVRGTTGRVDEHRAHPEDALEQRGPLIDGLHTLVGHVHALLAEHAGAEGELFGSYDEVQVLVADNPHGHHNADDHEDGEERPAGYEGQGQARREAVEASIGDDPDDGGEVRHQNSQGNHHQGADALEPHVTVVDVVLHRLAFCRLRRGLRRALRLLGLLRGLH